MSARWCLHLGYSPHQFFFSVCKKTYESFSHMRHFSFSTFEAAYHEQMDQRSVVTVLQQCVDCWSTCTVVRSQSTQHGAAQHNETQHNVTQHNTVLRDHNWGTRPEFPGLSRSASFNGIFALQRATLSYICMTGIWTIRWDTFTLDNLRVQVEARSQRVRKTMLNVETIKASWLFHRSGPLSVRWLQRQRQRQRQF